MPKTDAQKAEDKAREDRELEQERVDHLVNIVNMEAQIEECKSSIKASRRELTRRLMCDKNAADLAVETLRGHSGWVNREDASEAVVMAAGMFSEGQRIAVSHCLGASTEPLSFLQNVRRLVNGVKDRGRLAFHFHQTQSMQESDEEPKTILLQFRPCPSCKRPCAGILGGDPSEVCSDCSDKAAENA